MSTGRWLLTIATVCSSIYLVVCIMLKLQAEDTVGQPWDGMVVGALVVLWVLGGVYYQVERLWIATFKEGYRTAAHDAEGRASVSKIR